MYKTPGWVGEMLLGSPAFAIPLKMYVRLGHNILKGLTFNGILEQ